MEKRILAFDFGASSGRAMLSRFEGSQLKAEEIHRFSNDPVVLNGVLYWDIVRMMFEIKRSISPVSYTHLDVYKRQGGLLCSRSAGGRFRPCPGKGAVSKDRGGFRRAGNSSKQRRDFSDGPVHRLHTPAVGPGLRR